MSRQKKSPHAPARVPKEPAKPKRRSSLQTPEGILKELERLRNQTQQVWEAADEVVTTDHREYDLFRNVYNSSHIASIALAQAVERCQEFFGLDSDPD